MEIEQTQIGWRFWIFWVVSNLLGWLIAFGVNFLLLFLEGGSEGFALIIIFVGIPVFGGILSGIAQWVVLRQHISHAGIWAVASLIGWSVGGCGAVTFMADYSNLTELLVPAIGWAFPTLVGLIVQWWILRQHSSKAGWWIPSGGIIWIIGITLMYAAKLDLYVVIPFFMLGNIFVAGWILVWMLRHPKINKVQAKSDGEVSANTP